MTLEAKGNILTELYVQRGVKNPPEFTTSYFQVWAELIVRVGVNNDSNMK